MQSKRIITGIPFRNNFALDADEKEAVSHYRDAGTNQHDWNYFIPASEWKDRDCYMINGFLRGNVRKNELTNYDKQVLLDLIPKIHKAITKSFVSHEFNVYRGLSNDSWIEAKFDKYGNPIKNKGFIDYAFGSFSSNSDIARKYTRKHNSKNEYYLVQKLKFGELALFIDDKECEWLLPPNTHYFFKNKEVIPLPNGGKQITYYIGRANK